VGNNAKSGIEDGTLGLIALFPLTVEPTRLVSGFCSRYLKVRYQLLSSKCFESDDRILTQEISGWFTAVFFLPEM
jgi:hypothetical protein